MSTTPHHFQGKDKQFLLPRDTNEVLLSMNKDEINNNLSLNINKYFLHVTLHALSLDTSRSIQKRTEIEQIKKALKYYQSEKKKKDCNYSSNCDYNKLTLTNKLEPFEFHGKDHLKEMVEKYFARRKSIVSSYNHYVFLYSKLVTPLAIGLGSFSVSETNIYLHHTLGIPIIPASSIKGALRSYVIEEYFDLNEENALKDPLFNCIFGYSKTKSEQNNNLIEHAGAIIFFDAYPVLGNISESNGQTSDNEINILKIELDIMTPHYPKYYSGEQYPSDNSSPNPLPFPVVKEGTFLFMLAINDRIEIQNICEEKFRNSSLALSYIQNKPGNNQIEIEKINVKKFILDFTIDSLKNLLEFEGIGAKTSLSYGLFKVTQEYTNL